MSWTIQIDDVAKKDQTQIKHIYLEFFKFYQSVKNWD